MTSTDLPFKYALVDGIVFPSNTSQQRMDELRDFSLRAGDIFLVTYPKCGTTWMQQIMELIRNGEHEDGTKVDETASWLEAITREKEQEMGIGNCPPPRVLKSHAHYHMVPGGLPHTTPAKYIYVARNPKDCLVSYYHHALATSRINYTGTWDQFFELFISGRVPYGSWFDHVLEWWKHRDDANMLFLKYEDMKRDLPGAVAVIAEYMGYQLQPEVIESVVQRSSFESMKRNSGNLACPLGRAYIRKGIVGDWKNHFSAKQVAVFDAFYAAKMQGSGLWFDFEEDEDQSSD